MSGSFSVVFKGLVCENVLLFEVIAIADDLSKSIVVGSVVVNIACKSKMNTYIQGHSSMTNLQTQIVNECIKNSKKIIEVMQMEH